MNVPFPTLHRLPAHVSFEDATATQLAFGTAWHVLINRGGLRPGLMSSQLRDTLCDHAAGNYRILTTLAAAAQRDLPVLDEKLYLEVFAQPEIPTQRRAASRR